MQTISAATLGDRLRDMSKHVYTALDVPDPIDGPTDEVTPYTCDGDNGRPREDQYGLTHWWQINDIKDFKAQFIPAVKRLKEYGERQGWEIAKFKLPPDVLDPIVVMRDPRTGYGVWVKALTGNDLKRIIARVSSPCVKVPPGGENPAT
ncbi:hypothetical protein ACQUSR_16650 [Streptomyces sp. P1-3]|uniref:hypothetical protein n=1 Tax=Streptomyces sp. P1-3 TaxID=3421658 RepID=UPI003D3663BD